MVSPFQALISAVDCELQRNSEDLRWGTHRKAPRTASKRKNEQQNDENITRTKLAKICNEQSRCVSNTSEVEEEDSVASFVRLPSSSEQLSASPQSVVSTMQEEPTMQQKLDVNDRVSGSGVKQQFSQGGGGGTSNYRGVSWHTQTGRWKAQIKVNGKDVNLGRHKDELAAARAYDKAAVCARGVKHAKLNFPLQDYTQHLLFLTSTPLHQLAAQLRGVEERLSQQTSKFHGVRLNKRTNRWEAYIRVAGKHVHLGCHDCEIAAAQVYDQALVIRCMYQNNCNDSANSLSTTQKMPETNFPVAVYSQFLAQLCGFPLWHPFPVQQLFQGVTPMQEKYVQNLLEKCRSVHL